LNPKGKIGSFGEIEMRQEAATEVSTFEKAPMDESKNMKLCKERSQLRTKLE
jgi:hypothetical protein